MSGFYRYGSPGADSFVHINTGSKPSGSQCGAPRFDRDSPRFGPLCNRLSVALCDAPKCDKPICELHRTKHQTKGNTDFCPEHMEMAHQ